MSGDSESLPVTLGQQYRVKLGKSFTFPERNAFHSLKCKFSCDDVVAFPLLMLFYEDAGH